MTNENQSMVFTSEQSSFPLRNVSVTTTAPGIWSEIHHLIRLTLIRWRGGYNRNHF
jgi:hypothetical protein